MLTLRVPKSDGVNALKEAITGASRTGCVTVVLSEPDEWLIVTADRGTEER